MTEDKKALDQAMQAAVAELKGAAAEPDAPAEAKAEPVEKAADDAVSASPEKDEAPKAEKSAEKAEPKAEKSAEKKADKGSSKKPEGKKDKPSEKKKKTGAKPTPAKKKSAAALKELAKVRRNKIIGITAAVIAIMVGIFLIARPKTAPGQISVPSLSIEEHGGTPEIKDDGTEVYPDGTTVDPDGTVKDADGNVIDHVNKTPDAQVTPNAGPIDPGDTNISNVVVDGGANAGAVETPWAQLTDADYEISIRRLNAYSGPFLEDGTNADVSNILALQFRNDGAQAVQYAEYVFNVNGVDVPFKITNLEAGQRCVVLAGNKQAYNAADVLKLKSRLVARVDEITRADDKIIPVDNSDNTVTIMNLTNQPIPVARVFYKTYYAEQNTFVGGITYMIEVRDIPANGSKTVPPEHFQSGMSMFVGYNVYDS